MVAEDVVQRVLGYIQHQGRKSSDGIAALVGETHARLHDVLHPVTDDQSLKAPTEAEWCLRELIRHVIAAQDSVALLVHHLARGEEPPPRPGGVGMQSPDDDRPFAAWVGQLAESNASMIEVIRALPAEPNIEMKYPHPFFGQLNAPEWAAFQRVHDTDHIQHAQRILRETA